MIRAERIKVIEALCSERILMLDGGMGTQIQTHNLIEADYRSSRFKDWSNPIKGNNDILNLTQPDLIGSIHKEFFQAGSDFIETNTFSSTTIAQADYAMAALASEIAREGARIARHIADQVEAETGSIKAVLGAIGPTNRTLSLSPDAENPGYRAVSFDQVRTAYAGQALAMAEYIDFFLIETVFDTLNAKAAIKAILDLRADGTVAREIPIIISGTITDASGRTLSGQTTEAFYTSIKHANPWAVGLNCALGAEQLRPYVQTLSCIADTRVIAYPNAGLPNAFGEYDETPQETASFLGEWARAGLINIAGGCCGTTPEHIGAIANAVKQGQVRQIPQSSTALRLSGLELFETL